MGPHKNWCIGKRNLSLSPSLSLSLSPSLSLSLPLFLALSVTRSLALSLSLLTSHRVLNRLGTGRMYERQYVTTNKNCFVKHAGLPVPPFSLPDALGEPQL